MLVRRILAGACGRSLLSPGQWDRLLCVSCLRADNVCLTAHERTNHVCWPGPGGRICIFTELIQQNRNNTAFIVIPGNVELAKLRPCSSLHDQVISKHIFSPYSINQVSKYGGCFSLGCQPCRGYHVSQYWAKEESKVEKTVKALKDNAAGKQLAQVGHTATNGNGGVVQPKKSLWQRFVAVCVHYYHGFCLLAADVKISSKLLWQLMRGRSLTRREHNQLVRTTADMFRLMPLLVFILVPFAEFLLPVALYFFPNMLPSQFQDPKDKKDKIMKTLKAKLEMAKFLQKTIKETAVVAKHHDGQTVETFSNFVDEIRKKGTKPSTQDIKKFAKLFEDEITLDNLTRSQLRACCIILNITPIGSDALLRFRLQMKLRQLHADDKLIQKEGVNSLTINELQAANRARGMNALGVSEERLRQQLQEWLQLHLVDKIPTSLLLLSRALYLPDNLSTEEKLGATITQLADSATDEALVKVAEMSGETVDNRTKLEIIKHEEAIIAAEKEQLAKEIKLMEQEGKRSTEERKETEDQFVLPDQLLDNAPLLKFPKDEVIKDRAPAIRTLARETLKDTAAEITAKDLDDMETVLAQIANERGLMVEQDDLKGLKEEVSEYKEDLEELKDAATVCGEQEKRYQEAPAAKHLAKKVEDMIARLDVVMTDLQKERTHIQEKITQEELKEHPLLKSERSQQSLEKLEDHRKNLISKYELIEAVKNFKNIPKDSKLQEVFRVLDQDEDGNIDINQALKVLEHLSREHLKLSPRQLEELLQLLKNEAALEEEERKKETKKKKPKPKPCASQTIN